MKDYDNQFAEGWGRGSMICGQSSAMTEANRATLREYMKKCKAESIIELGCGDLFWHGETLPCRDYVGIDLHSRPSWPMRRLQGADLRVGNIASKTLSNAPDCDLAIARAVFIHLSNRVILETLRRLQGKVKWLVVSNNSEVDNFEREKARPEDYSVNGLDYDLEKEPFNLELIIPGAFPLFQIKSD